jgi:hypothetical protein
MKKILYLIFIATYFISYNCHAQYTKQDSIQLFDEGKIDAYIDESGVFTSRYKLKNIKLYLDKLAGETAKNGFISNPKRKHNFADGNDYEISFMDVDKQMHKVPKVFHLNNIVQKENALERPILYYDKNIYYILVNNFLDVDQYETELITFKNNQFSFELINNQALHAAFFGKKVNDFPSIYYLSKSLNSDNLLTYKTIREKYGSFTSNQTYEDEQIYRWLKKDFSKPQKYIYDFTYYPFEITKDALKYQKNRNPYQPIYSVGDNISDAIKKPDNIYKILDKYTIEIPNMPSPKEQVFNTCLPYSLGTIIQKNIYDTGNFKVPINALPDSLTVDYFALMSNAFINKSEDFVFDDIDSTSYVNYKGIFINKNVMQIQIGNCRNINKMLNYLNVGDLFNSNILDVRVVKLREERYNIFFSFMKETYKIANNYIKADETIDLPDKVLKKIQIDFTKATSLPANDFDFVSALNKSRVIITIHGRVNKKSINSFFKNLFFDNCNTIEQKFSVEYSEHEQRTISIEYCVNKIINILKISKCPVVVGGSNSQSNFPIGLNGMDSQFRDFYNSMNHALVVTGYRKVLNQQTGDTLELFKVLNSWGSSWQIANNDGWIDARHFIFCHSNSVGYRYITFYYIPLRKYIEHTDFTTNSINTQLIISETMSKGYKTSIVNYNLNPKPLNINLIYAKIDNEIKNKRWDSAMNLAKLYEYMIPLESGIIAENIKTGLLYTKIYYLMGYISSKNENFSEANILNIRIRNYWT